MWITFGEKAWKFRVFVVSLLCKTMRDMKTEPTNLTGPEKVLWKATYDFHLKYGASEEKARMEADAKIVNKRKLGKKLTYKF
jgi:hypothetical protein